MTTPALRIRLLGGFSVERDGAVVDERAWRLRKARSLVKVAALAPGRRVHRDVVAELLWPDRDAAAAANNLHQALHAARRALGSPAVLTLADDALVLDPDAWVDVDAFEAVADDDPEAALALYAGELLPEDRYEPWAQAPREALRERHVELCLRVADTHRERGDPGAGVALLSRAVAAEPLHEPAVRALMRALAAAGRRQDALAQFERLRTELRERLEADPDPETRALYRELLAGGVAPRAVPALPVQLTSFVGRERELVELEHLLGRTRLLTLTGPGGAGKTRLALEAAHRRAPALRDGAWFVDLGGLRDTALVPQAVARALGVTIPAARPAIDALTAHVAGRQLLVVLDTCEHLVDGCAHLAEALLAAGPGVALLATSREPLRAAAEVAWRVPALAEAATLFRERAAAVRQGGWTAEEEDVIADICWRLDGMPLAIELAAARTGALTVEQIAQRLGDALDVLSTGSRTALTRQQTLRAAIDWSHELLTGDERVLFRRLAVFAGGFGLEAAEAVAAGAPIPESRVADLLARVVDKSLVSVEDGRFRMMDTIRQFGEERLSASGERDAVAGRHLRWCLELAAAAPRPGALERDHDDLRAALAFAVVHDPQSALLLATRMWRFWLGRSFFAEGTRWIDAVLEAAPERTTLRVEALLAAAGLAVRRGDAQAHLESVDEAAAIYRELGDPGAIAEALQQLAAFDEYHHSSERSAALFAEAVATAERLDEPQVAASVIHASAMTPWARGDFDETRARLERALRRLRTLPLGPDRFLEAITFGMPVLPVGIDGAPRLVWESTIFLFRRLDRDGGIGLALNNLAWVQRAAGDLGGALALLTEALEHDRATADATGEALTLTHLGHLARTQGDLDAAQRHLAEGIAQFRAQGEHRDAAVAGLGLGLVLGEAADLDAARTLFGESLERFSDSDDLPAIAGTCGNWALVEERAGELERAADLYAECAAGWRGQQLARMCAWAMLARGTLLNRLGRDGEALAALGAAREGLAESFDAPGLTEADALLAARSPLSGRKEPGT